MEQTVSPPAWKKVLRIFYAMRQPVQELFSGEYKSVFKGQGMEFSEVREYTPGDDVRSINWRVTARYDKPFIKKFQEERELTIIILLDMSASLGFGSARTKKEVAAEMTALLGWSAMENNDRVGMLIFTEKVEKFIPPRKGRNQILELIREALSYPVTGRRTDLKGALSYLNRMLRKRAIIFLLSDFLSDGYEKILKVTARKHEVVPIWIKDKWEREIPPEGDFTFEDAESGEIFYLSCADLARAGKMLRDREEETEAVMSRCSLDTLRLDTQRPYLKDTLAFFRRRFKKR